MFSLTSEQQDIILNAYTENSIINASAGSGKTATLVLLVQEIIRKNPKAKILVVVFNKHIQKEISAKISNDNVVVSTLHAMGNALLKTVPGSFKFNKYLIDNPDKKYNAILNKLVPYSKVSKIIKNNCRQLLDLGRMTNVDFNSTSQIYNLASIFQIPIVGDEINLIPELVQTGIQQFKQNKWLDFGDMIYLPNVLDISMNSTGLQIGGKNGQTVTGIFDYILADEAQDFGKSMQLLVKRFGHKNSKFIFFGDRLQSINGFCGSDPYSFDTLADSFNCQIFSLTKTFRCPQNHIDLVNEKFGLNCTAFNQNPGILENVSEIDYDSLNPSFTILGRFRNGKQAKLWDIFFNCIANNIDVSIFGLNVYELCDKIIPEEIKEKPFSNSVNLLLQHSQEVASGYIEKNWKTVAEDYQKDCSTVLRLLEYSNKSSWEDFNKFLYKISNERDNCVHLSTVHTYKGKENDNVILLDSANFPYISEKSTELNKLQETCVHYVALTRSKQNLFFN